MRSYEPPEDDRAFALGIEEEVEDDEEPLEDLEEPVDLEERFDRFMEQFEANIWK